MITYYILLLNIILLYLNILLSNRDSKIKLFCVFITFIIFSSVGFKSARWNASIKIRKSKENNSKVYINIFVHYKFIIFTIRTNFLYRKKRQKSIALYVHNKNNNSILCIVHHKLRLSRTVKRIGIYTYIIL